MLIYTKLVTCFWMIFFCVSACGMNNGLTQKKSPSDCFQLMTQACNKNELPKEIRYKIFLENFGQDIATVQDIQGNILLVNNNCANNGLTALILRLSQEQKDLWHKTFVECQPLLHDQIGLLRTIPKQILLSMARKDIDVQRQPKDWRHYSRKSEIFGDIVPAMILGAAIPGLIIGGCGAACIYAGGKYQGVDTYAASKYFLLGSMATVSVVVSQDQWHSFIKNEWVWQTTGENINHNGKYDNKLVADLVPARKDIKKDVWPQYPIYPVTRTDQEKWQRSIVHLE